jgi:hypothetical protein
MLIRDAKKLVFSLDFMSFPSPQVKAEFKHDAVTLNTEVDLNLGGPLVNASAVIGHCGWLAGCQLAFDSSKSKLTKNHFGIGYATKDFPPATPPTSPSAASTSWTRYVR